MSRDARLKRLEGRLHPEPEAQGPSIIWEIGPRRIDMSPTAPPQTWVIGDKVITF